MNKQVILQRHPELELTEWGDFKIRNSLVKNYKIIDIHCHLFLGIKQCFKGLPIKEDNDLNTSLFSKSCFPYSVKSFNLNEVYFTEQPTNLRGKIVAKHKLLFGGFVVKNATKQRLLRDMQVNNISKSIVLQTNPANFIFSKETNNALITDKLDTFGSIHPLDNNIKANINKYMENGIKGWKINPHSMGVSIDNPEFIKLIKQLAETELPILSCSGQVMPNFMLKSWVVSKKQERESATQNIHKFNKAIAMLPKTKFILAHGGLFETEELIKLMKKYSNVYTDISTQPPQNIKSIIEAVGPNRVLYGTDYPFFNQSFSILAVLKATENVLHRKQIFAQNTESLLKLSN